MDKVSPDLGIGTDTHASAVIQADFVAIHDPTAVRVIRTDRAGLRGVSILLDDQVFERDIVSGIVERVGGDARFYLVSGGILQEIDVVGSVIEVEGTSYHGA